MTNPASNLGATEIFLADPDRSLRTLLTDVLKAMGFSRVFPVESIWNVIRRLEEAENSVIICDGGRSPNDAIHFVKALRWAVDSPNRQAPIVLMLYAADMDLIVEARDAGVNEVLLKPVSGQALKARLNNAISSKRPFIESWDYVGPCRRRRRLPFDGDDLRVPDVAPQRPTYDRTLLAICSRVREEFDAQIEETEEAKTEIATIPVSELREGQILAADVVTKLGRMALAKGIRLNHKLIGRLDDMVLAGFIADAFAIYADAGSKYFEHKL